MSAQLKAERDEIASLKDKFVSKTREMSDQSKAAGTDIEAVKKAQEDQRKQYVVIRVGCISDLCSQNAPLEGGFCFSKRKPRVSCKLSK